jgi:hypothetical protein
MYDDQIFSIAKPCNNQKLLVTHITMTKNLWSPFSMATKIIQFPLNNGNLSNDDQMFLLTIQHTPTIRW